MQQTHQPARIFDSLLPPYDGLLLPGALVLVGSVVLGHAVAFVDGTDGEDEEKGEGGTGREGEHLGVG